MILDEGETWISYHLTEIDSEEANCASIKSTRFSELNNKIIQMFFRDTKNLKCKVSSTLPFYDNSYSPSSTEYLDSK